jgi:XTP/dITP diphosphohydrolase
VRLLIATTNQGKIREIRELLAGVAVEISVLADRPPIETPDEVGRTFEDNARAKALYYAARSGMPTVAEDSGLEIDALDGAPGVESARYGGANTTYPQKFELIYDSLRARGVAGSTARFVCAVALADGAGVRFEARGTIEGKIALEPRGTGGFGYDPIFFYPPFGCTLAEAGPRKAEVSHRAKAFQVLSRVLAKMPTLMIE